MDRVDRLSRAGWAERVRWAAGYPIRFLRRRLQEGTAHPATAVAFPTDVQVLLFQGQLGRRYCPSPYPGPVLFVSATAGPDARIEAPAGWSHLAKGLEVVRVDGTHQTVVTTHLPGLVAERLATLDRCEP